MVFCPRRSGSGHLFFVLETPNIISDLLGDGAYKRLGFPQTTAPQESTSSI
jgi:hypothetical protein